MEYVYARIVEPARLALEVYSQTSFASVWTTFFVVIFGRLPCQLITIYYVFPLRPLSLGVAEG